VSGFVISELCSEWESAKAVYLWVPAQVAQGLQWIVINAFSPLLPGPIVQGLASGALAGWVEGIWTIFVVPAVVWLLLGFLVVFGSVMMLDREVIRLRDAWRRIALPMAVLLAAGQMAKGLAKFVSWVGFLPPAVRDPAGVDTALAIHAKTLPQPAAILPMPAVSILAMLLVLAGGWLALREARLSQPDTHGRYAGPLVLLTAWFLFITFGWGYLPQP
jgi:hypothetical protein